MRLAKKKQKEEERKQKLLGERGFIYLDDERVHLYLIDNLDDEARKKKELEELGDRNRLEQEEKKRYSTCSIVAGWEEVSLRPLLSQTARVEGESQEGAEGVSRTLAVWTVGAVFGNDRKASYLNSVVEKERGDE